MFVCFLELAQDGSGLRVVVAVDSPEEHLGIFEALVNDSDHVDETGSFLKQRLEILEVEIDGANICTF